MATEPSGLRATRECVRLLHRGCAGGFRGRERVRHALRRLGRSGRRLAVRLRRFGLRCGYAGRAPRCSTSGIRRTCRRIDRRGGSSRRQSRAIGSRRWRDARELRCAIGIVTLRGRSPRPSDRRAPGPGVNLVGFLEVESGLGEIARRLAGRSSRRASRCPRSRTGERSVVESIHPHGRSCATWRLIRRQPRLPERRRPLRFGAEVGAGFFAKRYSIGRLVLGDERVPARGSARRPRFLDELWVASDYVREAIAPRSTSRCTS